VQWEQFATWTRGIGFIAAASLFWLQYFDLKDYLRPEPRRMLALSFLLGAGSAIVGLGLYYLIPVLGGPEDPGGTNWQILLYCLLLVGPIEEGVKFIAARFFIFRSIHFDEPIDGLIYSSAIAIGFASFESLIYTNLVTWPHHIARAITAPITHSLFASIWGFATAYAFFQTRNRTSRFLIQVVSLIAAMLLHGFYDFVLLGENLTLAASGISLALWIALILYARKSVHSRPLSVTKEAL
jgi:RsiW-degrading membrane proteinase PrsW (M82 family)